MVAPLATRYRVLRCDTRGHGRSPAPPGPYAIADLVADQLALLDELGIDRASFVGLSHGRRGLHAAGGDGARAGGSPGAVLDRGEASAIRPAGWSVRRRCASEGTEALADVTMERWFTPEFAVREPDAVARIREVFAATDAEGYAACCEAIAAWDFADRLGEIAAPTMVVGGRRDPTVCAGALAGAGGRDPRRGAWRSSLTRRT